MKNVQLFAVCSLFAAASAIAAQPAPPTIPADLDHFNCYLSPGPIQPASALLQDQFDVAPPSATFLPGLFESVTDLRSLLFCNPAQKTTSSGVTTPILHPDAHLLMYLINPQASTPRRVTVVNQFGTFTLQTGRAVILAVPSGKALLSTAAPPTFPPIPPPQELDHFKCYAAAGDDVDAAVSLTDQFRTEQVRVLRPFLFCNPVQKEVLNANNPLGAVPVITTPITHPLSHLTCYLTTPVPFQGVVIYNNQFAIPGTVPTLALSQSELLCVPSAKASWSVIPTPAQTSTGPAGS
jgi:hypothetical protein